MSKKIVIFGGSFNPPGIHHRKIVEILSKEFDEVKVVPCGPRPDKRTTNEIEPIHRAAMVDITFRDIAPNVEVDLFDLENATFTRNQDLEEMYSGEGEVWHAVGVDMVKGGKRSEIYTSWERGKELWENLRFAVIMRDGHDIEEDDLPPKHIKIDVGRSGSSFNIRAKHFNSESLEGLVTPEVYDYIERYSLYRGVRAADVSNIQISEPRLLIFADPHNKKALELKNKLKHLEDKEHPNLIVVLGGDGTMLHVIRENWRMRLPFLGINMGNLGFLLNDVHGNVSEKMFSDNFILRHAPLIAVDARHKDGSCSKSLAFNDAFVHADPGMAGWFEVEINGQTRIEKLVSDGVLAATPAGSTAYARSMGANPVPIGTDVIVIVGSNVMFPDGWRHGANVTADSNIVFRNADKSGKRKIYGFVDTKKLGEIEEMKIRSSKIAAAEILFVETHDIQIKLDRLQFPG